MNEIESKQTVDERAQKLLNTFGNIDTELPFIPALRVAQPLSGVVSGGKCQPGEFFYNQDTVLGESIPAWCMIINGTACNSRRKRRFLSRTL
jgi:hypothetical protein